MMQLQLRVHLISFCRRWISNELSLLFIYRIFEKTYPINPDNINKEVDHNGIKGGYLYDIKVRWTITPDWGDSTIEFYTRDWVHNSIPEIVL